jgi:hypothetical protein
MCFGIFADAGYFFLAAWSMWAGWRFKGLVTSEGVLGILLRYWSRQKEGREIISKITQIELSMDKFIFNYISSLCYGVDMEYQIQTMKN